MTALLTEQPIENRKSEIENPQHDRAIIALLTHSSIAEAARSCGLGESTLRRWLHQPDFVHAYSQARQQAFSVALGHLQHLSQQAVDTLQSLMQDAQASPSVRLSAARTVMQMSFKGSELLTLQTRLDQLETGLAALDSERQEISPPSPPQAPINSRRGTEEQREENRPLNPSNPLDPTQQQIKTSPLTPLHTQQNKTESALSNSERDGRGGEGVEAKIRSFPLIGRLIAPFSEFGEEPGEGAKRHPSPSEAQVGMRRSGRGIKGSPPLARYERAGEGLGEGQPGIRKNFTKSVFQNVFSS